MKTSHQEKGFFLLVLIIFVTLLSIKISLPKPPNNSYAKMQAYPAIPQAVAPTGFEQVKPIVHTYLSFRSTASYESLRKNLPGINAIITDALHLQNGKIAVNPNAKDEVYQYIRKNKPETKIFALVNNYFSGAWQGEAAEKVLNNPSARETVQKDILSYVEENSLDGVSLDFENMPATSQMGLVTFSAELAEELHRSGKSLSVHVPAETGDWRISELSKVVDKIIVMAYDENSMATSSGPIASSQWFQKSLSEAVKKAPANKVVVGMGNYSYDWVDGSKRGESLSSGQALSRATKYQAKIQFDAEAGNNFYKYIDGEGRAHTVWMLDSKSVERQMMIAEVLNVSGFALYRLGSEDPSVWKVLK